MTQNILTIIVIAAAAVGLFVLAMSITLLAKGRHIDSEIGTNPNMKERGITCAVDDARKEYRKNKTGDCEETAGCSSGCSVCGPGNDAAKD